MAAPSTSTCTVWADEADLCSPCDDYELLGVVAQDWLQLSSDVLYEMSGRRFPGECDRTVRPCARSRYIVRRDSLPVSGWHRSWGWCRCRGTCSCRRNRVELGAHPVVAVSEVKVDGLVLDPARYRVDEYHYLVRLPDADGSRPGWPATQDLDLDDTEEGTWSVTFTWGRMPPPSGTKAAAALACDLALGCQPETAGKCRLPKKVQSITRQGVQIVAIDLATLLNQNATGIPEVDAFLKAYNPKGLRRASSVWVPGMDRAIRTDT